MNPELELLLSIELIERGADGRALVLEPVKGIAEQGMIEYKAEEFLKVRPRARRARMAVLPRYRPGTTALTTLASTTWVLP